MKLLDVLNSPWAIMPAKLAEIGEVYATHMRGEKIDIKGVEARIGRPLQNESQGYDVINGVAIVPVHGVLAKRANLFMQISGGASLELIGRDLQDALDDPSVNSIILDIDSPGGTVDGTQQLANLVRQARTRKRVVALADGCMASAAYWVGSAAESIYIADTTTMVGSIGVVTTHVDVSAKEAQTGIKTTEISAGKYKRIASQYAALSPEGFATIQSQMDYLYELFVDAIAANRGVSTDKVLSDMADGRVFIGQQAIDAGLVDGVSTLDDLITKMAAQPGAGAARTQPMNLKGTKAMTREELMASDPQLVQALLDEGRAAGAEAERARILGIEANTMPGHEALIAQLKADGATTPDQAAAQVLRAEKAKLHGVAADLASDAPVPVPAQADQSATVVKTSAQLAVRANQLIAAADARGEKLTYAKAVALAQKEA